MEAFIALTKQKRNFDAEKYIAAKLERIHLFFKENRLDSLVIGISGGVDSAVAYKLLVEASKMEGSPLKKIVALLMPIYGKGTTNQHAATQRGLKLVENTENSVFYVQDLSSVLENYTATLDKTLLPDAWSIGQLASIVRTPNLYFHAALLQQQGYKSVVVGTTNRDEGAYIGFFGKASDAMVDLQPIADLHKSEVYQVAERLKVPQEILQATPTGDVWDGKVDEEMIGAPYWFLEMYLLAKEFGLDPKASLTKERLPLFAKYAEAIEILHSKNAHKYKVGNPAHFIDVLPRAVPGGWK